MIFVGHLKTNRSMRLPISDQ